MLYYLDFYAVYLSSLRCIISTLYVSLRLSHLVWYQSLVDSVLLSMSNTTPFPKESLQTVSGKVTAWLPLTTPWPSSSDCNTHVYAQNGDGTLIGWDPYFDLYVEPSSIHCLPPEVTSSWWQSNSDTVTLLGPSFACPSAYSAVQTNLIASSTQHILCCPS
jgi:hypothetical protein